MKPVFAVGASVVRLGWDGVAYEELRVTRIDTLGIWTTDNRCWTRTGLQVGERPGPNRTRIRLTTAADKEHFERLRLAAVLKNAPWMELSMATLTQVLLCLPPGTLKDGKEVPR